MDRFKCRLGWTLAWSLCFALAVGPLFADAAGQTSSKDDAAEETQVKESDLVKAARAAQKRAAATKAYTNDDLIDDKPGSTSYTNDDLTRLFGASEETSPDAASQAPDPAGGAPTQPMGDPLKAMEQEKQNAADRRTAVDEAEGKLAAAQAKLANLEKQLLATRNPFSARPELSAEEQEQRATSGETAAQRNARTQVAVEEARQEVAEAEANLARAKSQ